MDSSHHIQLLSIQVANKIAAGEVVDRPASIIKELIENSIDAHASQIDIEITAGGRKFIAVKDNGYGMNRDDALLSIERQATSKIKEVDDIERISTLGFRGEALAAIASVSRFRLTTCEKNNVQGTEISITGGKLQDVQDVGCPIGTVVEVRDIFFNVPARRKFLRSHQTELSHIRNRFIVQALACPSIGMSLKVDGREAYRLAGDSKQEDRLRDIFGLDYQRNLKKVAYKSNEVNVYGYIGLPSLSRLDRNEQYTFINGRATYVPLLSYAIREGYHTLLPKNRYPSVFLFIEMNPELVDVNVHPAKSEVRFRHPGETRDAIITAIRKTLTSDDSQVISQKPIPLTNINPLINNQLQIENLTTTRAFKYPAKLYQTFKFSKNFTDKSNNLKQPVHIDDKTESDNTTPLWSWCRVLGQIGGLYIILETEDGFVLMDPHAAHERVLFEKFMIDVLNRKIQIQNLLLPETVELNHKDAVHIRKNMELLKEMKFGISEFGSDTFVIDSLPACFSRTSGKILLEEIVHNLEQSGARHGKGKWREESIAQAACKSAVKAQDKMALEEIEQLVIDLARSEMPYTCPHGRPTMIFYSFEDLNRKFNRT